MTIAVDISRPRFETPYLPATAPLADAAYRGVKISVEQNLSALEPVWREFQESADCTVFQTYEWLSAWQANIGAHENVTPAIAIGKNALDKIVFILPLAIKDTFFGRELTWLACGLCDYNAPLLDRDFRAYIADNEFAEIWAQVQRTLQADATTKHDLVCLEKMPKLVGTQPNPMLQLDVSANPSGAHATALVGTWEEYYQAKRSSATRRRDRTKLKRLTGFGEVSFRTGESAHEALEFFDALIEQKSAWFNDRGIPNLFVSPKYASFYRAFVGNPASQKFIHVSKLQVGQQIAAANLGLVFQGRYHHVLASYINGEMSHFGPGAAHLRELMKYAIERGLRVFDFTIGDESYKREWCEIENPLFDHLSGATLRGKVAASLLRLGQSLKRFVKQTPVLWSLAATLRQRLFSRSATAAAHD
jgi:CelD/BcsL family acetyltransferase involved in cellulose biosynthesis